MGALAAGGTRGLSENKKRSVVRRRGQRPERNRMRFVVIDLVLSPIRPISLIWIPVPWQVSWLADQAEGSPSQPNRPVDI